MTEADYRACVEEAIRAHAGLERLVELTVAARDAGLAQRVVYSVLEELRARLTSEDEQDLVADVMDLVWGFCSPHARIWSTVLKT
jgi:hypothetical protein